MPARWLSAKLSRRSRFTAGTLGGGLLAALVLASLLRPDPRGFGTHEQLGLPPCMFLALFGRPCPACGMTTSWSLATRGHWAEAVQIHTTGTLLAGVALVVGLAAVMAAVRGRRPTWAGDDWLAALASLGLAAAVLCEWGWRHWLH